MTVLERETGIEPATNSLEGCDSTTELLPPTRSLTSLLATAGKPASRPSRQTDRSNRFRGDWLGIRRSRPQIQPRAKDGGEGRTRTFEAARATDLQSAAFDRFATSPTVCVWKACFLGAYLVCRWSWRRDLNPRPADYKSAALPTELRQLKQKTNFSTSCATAASPRPLPSYCGSSCLPATLDCTPFIVYRNFFGGALRTAQFRP
jgi:hypothetical protein